MFQHLQQQICNKQLQSWNGPNHQKKKQSRTKTFAKTKIQMIKNWSRWEFSEIKIYFHFKSDLAFCPQLNNLQPTLEDYFPVFASVWSYFMAIEWTVNKMNQDLRSPTFSKVAEVCFWFALQYILKHHLLSNARKNVLNEYVFADFGLKAKFFGNYLTQF